MTLYAVTTIARTECPDCEQPMPLPSPFSPHVPCTSCGAVAAIPVDEWREALEDAITQTLHEPEGANVEYTSITFFGEFTVRAVRQWPRCAACGSRVDAARVEHALAARAPYGCACGAVHALRPLDPRIGGVFRGVPAVFGEPATSFTFLVREELVAQALREAAAAILDDHDDDDDDDDDEIDTYPEALATADRAEDGPAPWEGATVGATSAREWALLLQTPLALANWSDPRLLGGYPSREDPRARGLLQMLERDWNVTSPEGLLEVLEWLRVEGHRKRYRKLLGSWTAPAWAKQLQQQNAPYLRPTTFLAWDAGRLAALAGWGALTGLISTYHAYAYILGAAAAVQPAYSAWTEYAWDYALGLQILLEGRVDAEFQRRTTFIARPGSLWSMTPWALPLQYPPDAPPPLGMPA